MKTQIESLKSQLWLHAVFLAGACVSFENIGFWRADGGWLVRAAAKANGPSGRSCCLVGPKPSTASTLRPRLFHSVSFHLPSFTSPRPQTAFMTKHGPIPSERGPRLLRRPRSDGSGGEEAHLFSFFFFALRGLWTQETSSKMCEEWAVCSLFGLKPQDRGFTAKSPSRADLTSAGSVEFVWNMLQAILLDNPNKKRGRKCTIYPPRIKKGKSLSLKLCCCFFPHRRRNFLISKGTICEFSSWGDSLEF